MIFLHPVLRRGALRPDACNAVFRRCGIVQVFHNVSGMVNVSFHEVGAGHQANINFGLFQMGSHSGYAWGKTFKETGSGQFAFDREMHALVFDIDGDSKPDTVLTLSGIDAVKQLFFPL